MVFDVRSGVGRSREKKDREGEDDGVIFIFCSDWNVSRDAVRGPPAAADCAGVGG